jgi:hypothetical protein
LTFGESNNPLKDAISTFGESNDLLKDEYISNETAWRILKLIREAMGNKSMRKAFDVFVEIDETYIGGKPRKGNWEKGNSKRGRGTEKTPVIGVKEQGTKDVYARVAVPDGNGQRLSGRQLLSVLDEICGKGTTVISDDFRGYNILDRKAQGNFYHVTVNHSAGEFSAGRGIHTNNIENFRSLVKREYI